MYRMVWSLYHNGSFSATSSDSTSGFQSKGFNYLVMTKVRLILLLLTLGFNVLLNDVDVVWLEDPIPYIPLDADIVGQNGMLGNKYLSFRVNDDAINTGFYFVKTNNRTIEFMQCVFLS